LNQIGGNPFLPLVQATMDRLAAECGLASPDLLYAAHAAELLDALAVEEPRWEAHSPGRFLLESLLRGCTAPVLQANLPRLLPMLANCVQLERCASQRWTSCESLGSLASAMARWVSAVDGAQRRQCGRERREKPRERIGLSTLNAVLSHRPLRLLLEGGKLRPLPARSPSGRWQGNGIKGSPAPLHGTQTSR
jgi:hypothetical protein